jgi:hypothetical protein
MKAQVKTLLLAATTALSVSGQTIAQDCAVIQSIWQALGQTTAIPSNCCSRDYGIVCEGSRLTRILWQGKGLTGSIPESIGQLNGLTNLYLQDNRFTGPLPSSMGNLTKLIQLHLNSNQLSGPLPPSIGDAINLQYIWLRGNNLTGPIPSSIGNLINLKVLTLDGNQLTGNIPDTIGNLKNLETLRLNGNQLTGNIPASMAGLTQLQILRLDGNQLTGNIPASMAELTQLQILAIYNNQLTGYPSALKNLPAKQYLFPNPMPNVPFDLVVPASAGTLSNVTWGPFMTTSRTLRKRQQTSTIGIVSAEELVKMCPLDNVQSRDVPAGCVAGIYSRFCYDPSNPELLSQCHDLYNRAFSASIFKPLGDVCPSWKKGPFSASCAQAVASFSYELVLGDQISVIRLTSAHAQELVKNIFAHRFFAPCEAPATCSWEPTSD